MAQETNQSAVPMLCATGCGFYGNPRTNGMCSVCYKDHLTRGQSSDRMSPMGPMGGAASAASEASAMLRLEASLAAKVDASPVSLSAADMSRTIQGSLPVTQQMTEMSISRENKPEPLEPVVSQPTASSASPVASSSSSASGAEDGKGDGNKPKKARCFMCRKKVGLTGFDCRCGNLFCGIHRYSDKHNCPYDYKAEAAAKIRKENPVVVADKIQRI